MDHFHELKTADVSHLPAVEGARWRWLWHEDFYDGPITGMVLCDEEQLYAEMVDECYDYVVVDGVSRPRCGFFRRFRLIRLTPSAFAECSRSHELFRKMVGLHCDYDENGSRPHAFESPPGWEDYYAMSWPEWSPDGEAVGFTEV